MSKKKEDAMLMQQRPKANADERKTYIKMVLDALSDADKASNKQYMRIHGKSSRTRFGARWARSSPPSSPME